MPEISRFFGIVIKLFHSDHNPPHFHASYQNEEALIEIKTLGDLNGKLSPHALGLVIEWASIHQAELEELWNKAQQKESLNKIEPLK